MKVVNRHKTEFLLKLTYRICFWESSFTTITNCLLYEYTAIKHIKMNSLTPPHHVRGMTNLERDKFRTVADVPYIVVPSDNMTAVFKFLKPHLLKMRQLNPVSDEDTGKKRILMHPHKFKEAVETLKDKVKDLYSENILWTKIDLEYNNWSSEDIFKAVLPEDSVGNVSSFSIIGHIIHLNLKPELLDYRFLIGQVLLDKYPNIKTVVNKCEIIDNTFRNFKMEHLAGECNYQVLVKENNYRYAFDFEKVFWNPRLGKERSDMANRLNSGDIVYDVFAGVGPFAVPMARKRCQVYANDLNPDSYHWLCHNAKLNKVQDYLHTYNLDGKDFIQTVIKQGLIDYFNGQNNINKNVHIIMNLPALALTFLKYFNKLLSEQSVTDVTCLPIVHCYFFKKKDETAENVIGDFLSDYILSDSEIVPVRVVAPNKVMMRISYKLIKSVLFYDDSSSTEPSEKRIKLSVEEDTSMNVTTKI